MTRAEVQRMRRRAELLGLKIIKSRRKYPSVLDLGGWQIINHRGLMLAGSRFELFADEVSEQIDKYAALLGGYGETATPLPLARKSGQIKNESYPIAAMKAPRLAVHKAPKVAVHKAPKISKTKAGGSLFMVSWFNKTVQVEAESAEAAAAHVAAGVGVTPDKVNVWKVK